MALRDTIRSGIVWTAGLNFLSDALQFATTAVLARLLEPAAYGQFALVTAAVTWLSVLSFRSFIEFALQEPDGATVDFGSYFAAGGILQVSLTLVLLGIAALLRSSESYRPAAPLFAVMSSYFLLDWFAELRVKMLERALDWNRLGKLRAAGLLLNASSAIVLALSGAGTYALLLPGLIALLPLVADLLIGARWRPTIHVRWSNLGPAIRFGFARIGSGLAFTSRQLVESSVLASRAGFTAAGFYGRATGFANLFCWRLPSVFTLMLRPVLARVDATNRYHHAAGLVLRGVLWMVIPASALCAILADPMIRIVYGEKWLPALNLLPYALAASSAAALVQTGNILLLGLSESRRCFTADLAVLLGSLASAAFIYFGRPDAYLAAIASVQIAVFGQQLSWLTGRGALRWEQVIGTVGPCVTATFGALVIAQPLFDALGGQSPAIRVFVYAPVYGLVYLFLLRTLNAAPLRELAGYFPGRAYLERVL